MSGTGGTLAPPVHEAGMNQTPGTVGHLRRAVLVAGLAAASGALAQQDAAPVVIATADLRAVVERVPVSGTVTSPRVARLSPAVAGLVQEVLVEAGDHVAKGEPLLRLDPALAQLAVDAAKAASDQGREELTDARRRLADAEKLAQSRGVAETEVRARRTEVRSDAATLRLREAEQRAEAERLRRHEIRAPFEGVISRKLTEVGEWVSPGDPVLELVADRGLRIDFRVPQEYFPRIGRDTPLDIRMDALPEQPVPGRIGEIVPVSDPSARTFLVRVYPEQPDLPLTPGMSASGTLRLRTGEQGVVVSRDALLRHPDGRVTVWVVEDGGDGPPRVAERQVRTGLAFDGLVSISSGLEAGARVVVQGNEALQQDQRIAIRKDRGGP